MHPLTITSGFLGMFIQSIPGGKGIGMMYMVMYIIITVFIVGLMSGRTPEYLGIKITGRDVKLVMMAFLIHPIIILIPTVIAYASGAAAAIGVGGNSVGYTQILYEFTTAAANNGSDFLGASGNTPFFNIATAIVILIGRYAPIAILLALSGSMIGRKRGGDHRSQNRQPNIHNSPSRQHHHTRSIDVLPVLGAWTNFIILQGVNEWLLITRKLWNQQKVTNQPLEE